MLTSGVDHQQAVRDHHNVAPGHLSALAITSESVHGRLASLATNVMMRIDGKTVNR